MLGAIQQLLVYGKKALLTKDVFKFFIQDAIQEC